MAGEIALLVLAIRFRYIGLNLLSYAVVGLKKLY